MAFLFCLKRSKVLFNRILKALGHYIRANIVIGCMICEGTV